MTEKQDTIYTLREMEDHENIYDKIRELFGIMPGTFNILEEQIDIELQMQYFDFSRSIKENIEPEKILSDSDQLFSDKVSPGEKKIILVKLASIENVEAYRVLERYVSHPDPELKEWGILAFQESRMLLESKLLDENQVFISTGLGGKGTKLRYFIALVGKNEAHFSSTQKKIIKTEFEINLKRHDSEIEKINYCENIATVLAVVPMEETIKFVFEEAISECNAYGDFLYDDFIITNVKELSFREIQEFLDERKNEEL